MIPPVARKAITPSLFVLLYAIPIAWYYIFIFINSPNIPYGDDYRAILAFLNSFVGSDTLSDKLNLIFSQHQEYRITFCRLVTLLMYYISGSINFKVLCVISNLSLIGIVYLFYKSLPVSSFKCRWFIPSVFLLFHMQYWEASFWSTAALQQIWVSFFALLCFYYLRPESRGYCMAAFFAAVCAAYTNGNGLICFIIGLAILVSSRQFAKSLSWSLAAAAVLCFYFYDYAFKTIQLPPLSETVVFILSFLGSSISFSNLSISLLFGCFSVMYIIYLTYTAYYKRNPVIYSMTLFIVITALPVSIARSHIESYQALASRYNLNSTLLLLCIYLSVLEIVLHNQPVAALLKNKSHRYRLLTAVISLSICFCVMSYVSNLKTIDYHNQMLIRAVCLWQEKGNGGYLSFPLRFICDNRFYLKIFTESSQINAYVLPANPHNDSDGIPYMDDNCPDTYNPFQEDLDNNGVGDACDHCPGNGTSDIDGDGMYNAADNCCFVPNADQADEDANGIGNACDASFLEKHWLEAEQAVTIIHPLRAVTDDSASGDGYIHSPDGSGNQFTPGSAMAVYTVTIVKAGEFILWGRVGAADLNSDSFFVQIDDGFDNLWTTEAGKDWHWDKVNDRGNFDPVIFTLTRGAHTIKIKLREDGSRLDKLLLTNDIFTFTPEGKGEKAENADFSS